MLKVIRLRTGRIPVQPYFYNDISQNSMEVASNGKGYI